MKTIFSKIIELTEYQVLITKEFSHDDDAYTVKQTTEIDGVGMSLDIGFDDEIKRNEYFDSYSEENANAFIEMINDLTK